MKLFLDDTRQFPESGYQCCRTAKAAITLMSVLSFDFITLDYNLGDGGTGMEVLVWMKENNVFVKHINIHSNHIIGKERMRDFCKEHFKDSVVTMNMLLKN